MKRLAVLLCLAGLVAACGSGKDSGPVSFPPVTATEVPSSPAAPSVAAVLPKPSDADAPTSEGAAAFVRYYFAVLSQAIVTNDTSGLVSLTASECEGCQRYVSSIHKTATAMEHVQTEGLLVKSAVAPALMNDETTVLVDFDAAPFATFDSAHQQVDSNPGSPGLVGEVRCVRRGVGWIAMGFRLVKS